MDRTCAQCGATLPRHSGRGRPVKFCSDQCRYRARDLANRVPCAGGCGNLLYSGGRGSLPAGERMRNPCRKIHFPGSGRRPQPYKPRLCVVPARPCATCGRWWIPAVQNRRGQFCSGECHEWWRSFTARAIAAGRQRRAAPKPAPTSAVPWAQCLWCEHWFVGRNGRKYCSPVCAAAFHPYKKRVSPISYGDCVECGASFVRRSGQLGDFCSPVCSKRARKRDRKHRMRSNGGLGDSITIYKLAERDGWKCHLCGKKVSRRRGNHPGAPSIDHLIPIGRGNDGPHTWDNVALAHRRCNSERREFGEVQLRLIA